MEGFGRCSRRFLGEDSQRSHPRGGVDEVRPYNERRFHDVLIQVERREIPQKEAARILGITWVCLRVMLYRKRHVTKCNNSVVAQIKKVA